jgi:competence protein ComEC
MPLLCVSIGWILGIIAGSVLGLPVWTIAFGILPLALLPFLRTYYKRIILAAFVLLLFLGGTVYSFQTINSIPQDNVSHYNEAGCITVEGVISNQPSTGDKTSTFQLKAQNLKTDTDEYQVSGTILVKTSRYPEYHYGDLIRVTGTLETPQKYDDFDYKTYLAVHEIYSVLNYPRVEIIETGHSPAALTFLYNARNSIAQSIDRALPEPQSALAKGIFLGDTGDIPQSLREAFANTGTSHILAISGLHLTIIIGLMVMVGSLIFGRQYNIHIWLALLVVWVYALFTGLEMPIIRSAIMGSVFLLAEFLGRQRNALPALTLAAAVMLAVQPGIIADVSFQLSYLSMCGLILVYPQFQKLSILKEPEEEDNSIIRHISRIILTGLFVIISALIGIAPLISYYFGVIPVLSIPATIFILPVLPLIIATTALVGAVGLLLPFLAVITGWLDWLFVSYLLLIVRIFDALPLASIRSRIDQPWQVWCYYIVLIIILVVADHWQGFINTMKSCLSAMKSFFTRLYSLSSGIRIKWAIISLAVITALIWTAVITFPDDKLHVSVLDIGQGDAILVQTPSHQNILIDGGPSPRKLKLELGKRLPFWDRKIDLIIITQPQSDHITGLLDIIGDYKISGILQTSVTADSEIYRRLTNIIETKAITVSYVYAGQVIETGDDIRFEILHPPQSPYECSGENRDCNCLVTRLIYKDISFLFTADIPQEVELYLLSRQASVKSTVLKVAHHGSQTSSSLQFLKSVDMDTAAISAGYSNSYGHPSLNTIASLVQLIDQEDIFITSQNGTVEYITDGSHLWVKTDK